MNWKNKVFLFYAIGGLLLGVVAGLITINNAVDNDKEVELDLKTGAKVGVAALQNIKKIII